MKTKYLQRISMVLIFLIGFTITNYAQNPSPGKSVSKYKMIFIELGSVRCIPCQQMQSVMKSIEKKYGNQVKVVFHDVWTPEGKPFGKQYGVEAIPTQLFLDENGKRILKACGIFPRRRIDKSVTVKRSQIISIANL